MISARRNLSNDERKAWLRLSRTENVGPATFAALMARVPDVREALEAVPHLARRGGGALSIPSEDDASRELEGLAKLSGRIIAAVEPDFPSGLAALDPPLIAVIGHAAILKREMVAVVGARNASALGMKLTKRIAADLGEANLVVASGLARGIDSAAHEAALASGTVAVVAGGIDIVYPPENQALYESIRSEGAIVSEMPLGAAPLPRHFPRRNRIISGLSRGVVVIEAAERSGSLITANYALDQGREVFAVPGSPLDPRAKGANRLYPRRSDPDRIGARRACRSHADPGPQLSRAERTRRTGPGQSNVERTGGRKAEGRNRGKAIAIASRDRRTCPPIGHAGSFGIDGPT